MNRRKKQEEEKQKKGKTRDDAVTDNTQIEEKIIKSSKTQNECDLSKARMKRKVDLV